MGQDATRRGVLAAVAAMLPLLAGCKGIGALGTPPSPQTDVTLARAAIASETLMIRRYKAVMTAVPSLRGRLQPLLSQHEEHLTQLGARLIDPGAGGHSASPGPSGHPGAGTSETVGSVPATPAAAVAFLRRAERAAAGTLTGHLEAASPSFAQLLASIAASEATHALVLSPRGRP